MRRNHVANHGISRALVAGICGLLLLATACDDGGGGSDGPAPPTYEQRTIGLHAFPTCDALVDYLHAEALAEVEQFGGVAEGAPGAVFDDASDRGGAVGPEAPQGEGNGNGEVEYSRTNVQEAGVDEPDVVKTDGATLYVVHGSLLLVYDAADLSLLSQTALAVSDAQLLLDGDRLLVLGSHWGTPSDDFPDADAERLQRSPKTVVSLYDVGDPAAPALQRRAWLEGHLQAARLVGGTLRAAVHHQAGAYVPWEVAAPGVVDGGQGSGGSVGAPSTGGGTTVDADPDDVPPDEDFAEKQAQDEEEDWRAAWQEAIDATTVDDWLPRIYVAAGDERTEGRLVACEDVHRPGERAGTGFVTVFSMDLDDPARKFADPAVVSGPGVVYASSTGLYLSTANHYAWGAVRGGDVAVGVGVAEPGTAVAEEPPEATEGAAGTDTAQSPLREADDERVATQLHKLDISNADGPAVYRASGRVYGVPLNQFSMGEYEDHLRIATTEERWATGEESLNHVFVLGEVAAEADDVAERALVVTGEVTDLAPGERIYAVRFIAERGFVVTFRQVDPLFCLDLADPAAPQLRGELKVPGFSTYLHPFDDDHLMGIGQSATDEGRVTGLQLSLFDVADMANPTLAHKALLGEGWSDALYDHHAFTWWAPESTLMVPINAWEEEQAHVGLNVYRVNLDDGFVADGHVSHADLVEGWRPHVRRSVVIGDAVYSMSDVGMKANGLDDLLERGRAVFPEDPGVPGDRDGPKPDVEIPEPAPDDGGAPDEGGADEPGQG